MHLLRGRWVSGDLTTGPDPAIDVGRRCAAIAIVVFTRRGSCTRSDPPQLQCRQAPIRLPRVYGQPAVGIHVGAALGNQEGRQVQVGRARAAVFTRSPSESADLLVTMGSATTSAIRVCDVAPQGRRPPSSANRDCLANWPARHTHLPRRDCGMDGVEFDRIVTRCDGWL